LDSDHADGGAEADFTVYSYIDDREIMLNIYFRESKTLQMWRPGVSPISDSPIWLDLIDPSEEERHHAAQVIGVTLPTRGETSAIELSSRLRASKEVLRLNIPSFVRADGEKGPMTPLGFVLTPRILATVRYAEALSFNEVAKSMGKPDAPGGGTDIFIDLIESIVDVGADRIEDVAGDLSKLSREVFLDHRKQHRLLRGALFEVGALQLKITQIRFAMLGLSRVVTYMCESAPPWIDANLHVYFKTVQQDIGSLREFDQQLSERLQFLLDAVLGFINNEQNDIMRVLTIVSVATVPPMILAGIWGMNFKSIPEYNWQHGYAFALAMILLSMIFPLLWFKLKRWL
jgi:magnesium transporter